MKKGLTEMVFILDRSGSMGGLEKDTIGGFNSLIEKQKKEEGEAYVSTVLFDNDVEVLYDRIPLNKIEPMNEKQYFVRGCTALLDALGGAIHHIGNIHKYAREEDVPENTVFVITTDGMENASRNYTKKQVKEMVEKQQKEHGWQFVFLGANIDAVSTAESYGIPKYMAAEYEADSHGTEVMFKAVAKKVSMCRAHEKDESKSWAADLDKTTKRRKS